jgi:hypothetical protein
MDATGRLERFAASADATLAAAGTTVSAAAEALASLDTGLGRAESSSDEAALLARNAAVSLDALASAMQISIFGTQPLVTLSDDFAANADQAAGLADELDEMGDALGSSRSDVGDLAVALDEVEAQIAALRGPLGAAAPSGPAANLVLVALVSWLAVLALGAIGVGIALLRGAIRI